MDLLHRAIPAGLLHRAISSGQRLDLGFCFPNFRFLFCLLDENTGHRRAGFIGSHIVEYFQGRAEVRVLDNLRSGFEHNLAGFQCELLVGSILDRDPHALSLGQSGLTRF